MKNKSLVIIFVFVLLFSNYSLCQNINDSAKNNTIKSKGVTELEFAILGVGINRLYHKGKHSLGWGINLNYANLILSTNNSSLDINNSIDSHFSWDFIKTKFIYRLDFQKFLSFEISPIAALSVFSLQEELVPSYGLEMGVYYFNWKRVKFSTAVILEKSFLSRDLFLTLLPLKINIKIRKHE